MRIKKYTSISLPPDTIHELELWREAYLNAGIKLTKEKLLETILAKHRRYLWRDKEQGQEIVTYYKALKLIEREEKRKRSIDLFDAYELVKKHDEDTSGSFAYSRVSDYVYDRDIDGIEID